MSTTDATQPAGDYEDVTKFGLDEDLEEQLLRAHDECTFIWSNKEGWPVGVLRTMGSCSLLNRISCSCLGESRLNGAPASACAWA